MVFRLNASIMYTVVYCAMTAIMFPTITDMTKIISLIYYGNCIIIIYNHHQCSLNLFHSLQQQKVVAHPSVAQKVLQLASFRFQSVQLVYWRPEPVSGFHHSLQGVVCET